MEKAREILRPAGSEGADCRMTILSSSSDAMRTHRLAASTTPT